LLLNNEHAGRNVGFKTTIKTAACFVMSRTLGLFFLRLPVSCKSRTRGVDQKWSLAPSGCILISVDGVAGLLGRIDGGGLSVSHLSITNFPMVN
jgi:hypothetical protein